MAHWITSPEQATGTPHDSPDTVGLDSSSSLRSSCVLPSESFQPVPVHVEVSPPDEPSALVFDVVLVVLVVVEQAPTPEQLVMLVVVVVSVVVEPSGFGVSVTSCSTVVVVEVGEGVLG
ncbi:hypothetical protein D3C78_1084540 [compost metagenome]